MIQLQELIQNPTFCSLAWNHQFMDPTGRVKPCCRFEEMHRPPENHLERQTLKQVFFGNWMNSVRQKMLEGRAVDGCVRCYQEQEAGKKSLRQRYNESLDLPIEELVDLENPSLRWIELAISNDCNLACRMCDSRYSTRWFDEELKYLGQTKSKNKKTSTDVEQIYPFISSLVHLKFTGGEPLMTKQHWNLVQKMVAERDCSSILLNYSTNCTIFPKPEWVELWKKFRSVEFALSFDSSAIEQTEYIRWPAKMERVEAVTKEFLALAHNSQFYVILRSTISILNVWSLVDTIVWWLEHHPHPERAALNPTHLTHPQILSVTVLPSKYKQMVSQHLFEQTKGAHPKVKKHVDYIVNYMNSKNDSHLLPQLRKYILDTDEYRGQNFYSYYPYFNGIFSELPHDQL